MPESDLESRSVVDFDIAPDRADARTPPPGFYFDARVHARVLSSVVPRSFQLVNPRRALPAVGRARSFDALGDPARTRCIATREGEALRILAATCPHRGALLHADDCPADGLRCPYHGRRFAPDGRCTDAPGFEGELEPRELAGLAELEHVRWGPFAFARAAGARNAAAQRALLHALGSLRVDPTRLEHAADEDRHFEIAAPWALYVDNYLEGLHVPFVHPGLDAAVETEDYAVDLLDGAILQTAPARDAEGAEGVLRPDAAGRVHAARWLWLFPNTMLNAYPWGLSINIVEPSAAERCRVHYSSWIAHPELRGQGAGAALDTVEAEDGAVVELVARGLRGPGAVRGRYAPAELGVRDFHRLLVAALRRGA